MKPISLSPEKLRAAREAAGLSKVKAADAIGVTRATVLNAETGSVIPGSNVLARMALVYGVPMESLFDHAPEAREASTACGEVG